MNFHQVFAEWSQWLWPRFASHLWQASLFAFAVWVAAKAFERAPARYRYFFWLGAMAKFLLPSAALIWLARRAGVDLFARAGGVRALASRAFTWAISGAASGMSTAYAEVRILFQIPESAAPSAQIGAASVAAGGAGAGGHAELYCALTIVWLLGAVAVSARWMIRRRRFARALRGARTITAGREYEALERARSWIFVGREIRLVVSPQVHGPGVWRVRRPTLVFPEGVADRLSEAELAAVMTHEVVHVWRRDNLIGALQMFVCGLLWFHPLVWMIDRFLSAEREMWCDDTVLRMGGEPRLYAKSLWKVAQFGLGWPVAGVSRAAGPNLKRRVERMLKSDDQPTLTAARRAAAYGGVFALATLSVAVGLFGGDDSALAQGNKVRATDKKELARGVGGGIDGGVPGGVSGGTRGGVGAGAPEGVKSVKPTSAKPGDQAAGELQEPDSQAKGARTIRQSGLDHALYKAAQGGDVTDIDELLNAGANVNCALEGDGSPLIGAAREGRLAAVRLLLDRGADPNMAVPGDGNPLIMAAREGHADVVSLLLDRGANINQIVSGDENALIQASGGGHDRTVKLLIDRGADVNARAWAESGFGPGKGEWRTPIGMARKRGHALVVSILLAAGAQSDSVANPAPPPTYVMDPATRPTILYREKAEYTKQAQDNQVSGTVALSVVFGADAQIKDIIVVRGLPDGLTESAIESAKKIRFEPARKDEQPVSVRGTLEYSFKLK